MADYADIALAAGQTDYIARLNTLIDRTEALATALQDGFTANLNANSKTIANLANPTADQDAATKAYVNAVAVGGGSPGDIPATSLGGGTLSALQVLQRNATNDGWQGATVGGGNGKLFFFSGF